MTESPTAASQDVVSFSITSEGRAIPDEIMVMSIVVRSATGGIPEAAIVLQDGDPEEERFALADSGIFAPGTMISIKLGYDADLEGTVFKGVVVSQRIKGGDGDPSLTVTCRDAVQALAQEAADGSADIAGLIARSGGRLVDNTAGALAGMAKPQGPNAWDAIAAELARHGCLANVTAGQVVIAPPKPAAARLSVTYGTDITALSLEQGPGHGAGRMFTGDITFAGSAKACLGDALEVKIGTAFSDSVYISGVTHEMREGWWLTTATLGLPSGGDGTS